MCFVAMHSVGRTAPERLLYFNRSLGTRVAESSVTDIAEPRSTFLFSKFSFYFFMLL